jgi:hypothetical protein
LRHTLASAGAALFLLYAASVAHAQTATDDSWRCVIRRGDTLISLARAYLREPRDWQTIARLNAVTDPTRLRIGSVLRVPLRLMKAFAGSAEVVWARGDATVIAPDGARRQVTAGDRIATGARIETGAQSAIRVRLIDGALMLIGERSRVAIDDLTVFSFPGVTRTRLDLGAGRVETQVNPQRDPSSRYEIRTPVVTTAVRGTDFRVGMDEATQVARAEVIAGRVAAASAVPPVAARAGAAAAPTSITLDAGFGLVAAANAPLAAPRAIPPPPALPAPPDRLARLPVRVTWPAAPAARRYRAQLFLAAPPQTQIADLILDAPDVRWSDLADGAYRLDVRSIDDGGLEGQDASTTFTLDARPEPPFANAPANASRVYGDRTEFKWTKSDAATSYDLQVAADAGFTAPLIDVTSRADVSDAHALPPGVYYWRVASRDAAGERGPFGDAVSFTQRKYPEGRHATAGVDKTTLTLRWSAGEAGESSQFQLASDRAFDHVLVDRTLAESEVSVPRPPDGVYYLRVRALDADSVAGPFGPVQQIDVTTPPAPPRRHWWWWLVPPAAAAGVILVLL